MVPAPQVHFPFYVKFQIFGPNRSKNSINRSMP
jgi:hypothetical protein